MSNNNDDRFRMIGVLGTFAMLFFIELHDFSSTFTQRSVYVGDDKMTNETMTSKKRNRKPLDKDEFSVRKEIIPETTSTIRYRIQ
jgi:hypothetical protein